MISLSTISLLFALGQPSVGAPPKLTVVIGAEDTLEGIQLLKEQPSWIFSMVKAEPRSGEKPKVLGEARSLLEKAKTAEAQLRANETLQSIEALATILTPHLYLDSAVKVLAEGLRIKGRAHLYLDEPASANEVFISASFLDPAFSPDERVWPPKARLAYADSVASARNVSPGTLTIQLNPAFCDLWVDGKSKGRGSSTLSKTQPGEHFLCAACIGHQSIGARVITHPNGKLSQASLFLEKRADQNAAQWVVEASQSPRGSRASAELMQLLQTDFLLMSSKGNGSEWVLSNAKGELLGAPFSKSRSSQELVDFIKLHLNSDWTSTPPAQVLPWYGQWQTWALTGVIVAVGIGVGTYHIAQNDREDRVRLVVGR